MRLHVIPSFVHAFTNGHAFVRKGIDFVKALRMLGTTMLGPVGLGLLVAGFALPLRSKSNAVLWGWLAGGVAYTYVVLTVERVDYYLYPLVPLGALAGASALAWTVERFATTAERRRVAIGALALAWIATLWLDRRIIAPYYAWSRNVYVRSLRRAERHPQRRALLRRGRTEAARAQRRIIPLAAAFSAPRPGRQMAGVCDRSHTPRARGRGTLAGIPQARKGSRIRAARAVITVGSCIPQQDLRQRCAIFVTMRR
jgi:hypothetical protein